MIVLCLARRASRSLLPPASKESLKLGAFFPTRGLSEDSAETKANESDRIKQKRRFLAHRHASLESVRIAGQDKIIGKGGIAPGVIRDIRNAFCAIPF